MNITKQDLVNTYTRALADAGVTPEEGLHARAQTLADIAWDIKDRQPLEQSLENLAGCYGVDEIPDDVDIQAIIAELTDDSMSGPRVERKFEGNFGYGRFFVAVAGMPLFDEDEIELTPQELDKLDDFASAVITGMAASPEDHGCVDCCAEMAYDIARAMVKQRRKHREKGRLYINPKFFPSSFD